MIPKSLILTLVMFLAATRLWAEVVPHPLFSDHMVLQQQAPVTVWGSASPGETITVKFRDQSIQTVVGSDGHWKLALKPMTAEPGQTGSILQIVGRNHVVEYRDVLVGEVWLCSGQSNMQLTMKAFRAGRKALPDANRPMLRLMTKEQTPFPELPDYPKPEYAGWSVCTPETAKTFSATAYFFGEKLQRELGVPVGLITASLGATASSCWVPLEALRGDPDLTKSVDELIAGYPADYRNGVVARQKWDRDGRQGPAPKFTQRQPGELYELYIKPLAPFTIRGVIWDQGEAGTNLPGTRYAQVYQILEASWRSAFENPSLPFLYVQMPKGGCWGPNSFDKEGNCLPLSPLPKAVPAEKHTRGDFIEPMLALPNTYMAVSFDLEIETHPQSKDIYGGRFAATALNKVYGKTNVPCEGPMPRAFSVEGSQVSIDFNHAEGGLLPLGGASIQGFALAGPDGVFHWASASAEGDRVIVKSAAVKEPRQVGYAWAKEPRWANLFNKSGLPAQPFLKALETHRR